MSISPRLLAARMVGKYSLGHRPYRRLPLLLMTTEKSVRSSYTPPSIRQKEGGRPSICNFQEIPQKREAFVKEVGWRGIENEIGWSYNVSQSTISRL
jgi:hypothetical protein